MYNNIYLWLIQNISHQNKYLRWYINIVTAASQRASTKNEAKKLLGYTERHHIVPKGFNLGGEKDPNNLIYLSAREHFICHWLLIKMVKNKKFQLLSKFAMYGFQQSNSYQKRILTSIEYEIARKKGAEAIRLSNTGRIMPPRSKEHLKKISDAKKGKPSKSKGLIRSENTIQKLKAAWIKRKELGYTQKAWNKGIPRTQEQKSHQSSVMKGKKSRLNSTHTNETKEKISIANKGKVPHNKGKQTTEIVCCLFCKREIKGLSNFNRWHGINCKDEKQ